jgi:hypothetical protein
LPQGRVALFALTGTLGLLVPGLVRPSGDRLADVRLRIDPQAIEKIVFRCWREETCIKAGRVIDQPCYLNCWRLGPEDMAVWEYSGDLSPAELPWEAHLDTTRTPMRLDIINNRGGRTILPGIFKLEAGRLIWVTPDLDAPWPPLDPSGEYACRPTDFTATPANGRERRVLAPCTLYEQ